MAEPTDPGAVARALGRGAIVGAGGSAPVGWESAPRVVIDDAVVRDPASVLDELHGHWARREPVVVEVGVEVGALREPETETRAPYLLDPSFELGRERLYFLARSNNVDARSGSPVWGGALEAARLGASASAEADVVLPDGRRAWIDGGPRAGAVAVPDGHVVVHRVRVEEGSLEPDVVAGEPGELAPDQLAAVVHDAGPARIIAPAGSGKTRVLTERFRLLVRGRGWGSSSVTAVAYNVRAKDEMQSRLGDLSAGGLRSVRTLHSLGNAIVRAGSAVGDVIDERQVRERIQPLVEVRPKANTDMYAPYLEALGEVRLGLVPPAVVEAERDDVPGFASMFERYREGLARDRVIDHDEQIYGALEVLLRDVTVRRRFQRECRHLLVDEFQDLTPAQLLLLRLVAAPAYDVFGVGDDDQVIYGYAGADPDFLIRYDRFFPGAGFHDLEVNYRCPPDVVDAARTLLTYNRRRVPKTIRAARTAEEPALTVVAAQAPELAGLAFASVQARLADGVAATDLAVLARVNSALLPIQVLCTDAGIPCWTPVAVSVLNRTGSTAALAYLRMANAIAAGKKVEGDDVDIALRRPPRGIPPQVRERIRGRRWTLEALGAIADGLSGKAHDGFLDLLLLLARLGGMVRADRPTLDVLTAVRDESGLGESLAALDGSRRGTDGSHVDDVNALIAVAALEPDPAAFEAWLRARLPRTAGTSSEGVALATVHKVKGMEWPHVVVLGAHEGLMPHALADDVEEERRIFHVAITRCSRTVEVLVADGKRARFVDETRTAAPPIVTPAAVVSAPSTPVAPTRPARAREEVVAALDLVVTFAGSTGPIVEIRHDGALLADDHGMKVLIPYGERVEVDGRRAPLAPPAGTRTRPPVADADVGLVEALKEWRRQRAKDDAVPAYVVLNDKHLEAIAAAAPTTLLELARCPGIGPTKLERYGDEILAVVAAARDVG